MRGVDGQGVGGDWVDLREVVVDHHREIFRYARAFTKSDADAEDLAQSAVVRALQRGVVVSDPNAAKWYVLRIVRNLATDQARARARNSVIPLDDVAEAGVPVGSGTDPASPTDAIADGPDLTAPAAAFAKLAPADREVLRLRFLEELSYSAVAERMRTTEHGARQRVYRALQVLRTAMRPDGSQST